MRFGSGSISFLGQQGVDSPWAARRHWAGSDRVSGSVFGDWFQELWRSAQKASMMQLGLKDCERCWRLRDCGGESDAKIQIILTNSCDSHIQRARGVSELNLLKNPTKSLITRSKQFLSHHNLT